MIAAGVTLALANATAYTSALFDPSCSCSPWSPPSRSPAASLAAARAADHPGHRGGAPHACRADRRKPLPARDRADDGVPGGRYRLPAHRARAFLVLDWRRRGRRVCGAVISWVSRPGRAQAWLLTLLAVAALLVPAEQASLHTTASLNKHGDLGAWFAAIAAGYAVDKLIEASPAGNMRAVTCGACVIALCFPRHARGGPVVGVLHQLAQLVRLHCHIRPAGRITAPGACWSRTRPSRSTTCLPGASGSDGPAHGTSSCRPGPPPAARATKAGVVGAGNAGTFAMYIQEGYFSLIALNFSDTTSLDQTIAADIHRNHSLPADPGRALRVRPAGPAPGTYVIWRYEPQS